MVKDKKSVKAILYSLSSILVEFIQVNKGFKEEKPDNLSTYRWSMLSRYKALKLTDILKFQLLLSENEPKLNEGDFLFGVNYLLIKFLK